MIEDDVKEQKIHDKIKNSPPVLGRKLIIAFGDIIRKSSNAQQSAGQSSSRSSTASSSAASSSSSTFFNQAHPEKIVKELFNALKSDFQSAGEINALLRSSTKIRVLLDITTSNNERKMKNKEFSQYRFIHNVNADDMLKLNKLGKRILDEIFKPILDKNGVQQSFKELCNNDEYSKHMEKNFGVRWNLMVTDALANTGLFSDEMSEFYKPMQGPGKF